MPTNNPNKTPTTTPVPPKFSFIDNLITVLHGGLVISVSTFIAMYGKSAIPTFLLVLFNVGILIIINDLWACISNIYNKAVKFSKSANIFALFFKLHFISLYLLLQLNVFHIPNWYVYIVNAFYAITIFILTTE